MTKQRVLIPGGAGYIGSHIVLSVLETRRYKVTVVDNFHNAFPEAIKRVEKLALASLPADASQEDKDACKVDVIKGDVRDIKVFDQAFEQYKGDEAIHAVILVAALKAVGESSEKPIDYYEVNTTGLINLLRSMREHKITRFVYSSSATVYGTPKVVPIPETSPLQGESVYGRTKQIAEIIIKDVCDAYPEFRAISLRYFNPAGSHASGQIGEDPRGKPGNLLPLLSAIAVGRYRDEKGGLKINGNDFPTYDGTCVRDYLFVGDLANGHVNALDAVEKDSIFPTNGDGHFKAYNLGTGNGQSVLTIIAAMKQATGYDYPTTVVGRRKGDVPELIADPALAKKELGFKADTSLEEMARTQWLFVQKNPNGYEEADK